MKRFKNQKSIFFLPNQSYFNFTKFTCELNFPVKSKLISREKLKITWRQNLIFLVKSKLFTSKTIQTRCIFTIFIGKMKFVIFSSNQSWNRWRIKQKNSRKITWCLARRVVVRVSAAERIEFRSAAQQQKLRLLASELSLVPVSHGVTTFRGWNSVVQFSSFFSVFQKTNVNNCPTKSSLIDGK